MNKQEVEQLIDRYLLGECTLAEKALIERFYMEEASKRKLPVDAEPFSGKKEEMWRVISSPHSAGRVKRSYTKIAAAAMLFLTVAAGLYLFSAKQQGIPVVVTETKYAVDLKPGGNKAVLTLFDGRKIILNEVKNGLLSSKKGSVVRKISDGEVSYQHAANLGFAGQKEGLYNTLETPRGGQYRLELPDGTKVWLNAASVLRFPADFSGKERQVSLIGEAYFEVAKRKAQPFKVKTGAQVIEVLGTHFNITAYPDEQIYKTTLLEGSVKVLAGDDQRLIKPGEQARFKAGSEIAVTEVDVEEAVAWKNNKFTFNSQPLESIMRQISRWYNVDVQYKGNISKKLFTGSISRYANVSKVLSVLELTTQIHFKIEERRITVMP